MMRAGLSFEYLFSCRVVVWPIMNMMVRVCIMYSFSIIEANVSRNTEVESLKPTVSAVIPQASPRNFSSLLRSDKSGRGSADIWPYFSIMALASGNNGGRLNTLDLFRCFLNPKPSLDATKWRSVSVR